MTNIDVAAYNALPRNRHIRSPHGQITNHWHFDLRYIFLDPPTTILFLIHPEKYYIHQERLPLGLSEGTAGIAYFPETGPDAAPEICKALILKFLKGGLAGPKSKPHAPWKLTTEDQDLAAALTAEFSRMGVQNELCHVEAVVQGRMIDNTQKEFQKYWEKIKQSKGFKGPAATALKGPDCITFRRGAWLRQWKDTPDPPQRKIMAYARLSASCRPSGLSVTPDQIPEKCVEASMFLRENPTDVVRARADGGNAEAAVDYAMRSVEFLFCP
jgi:hypothetical protein